MKQNKIKQTRNSQRWVSDVHSILKIIFRKIAVQNDYCDFYRCTSCSTIILYEYSRHALNAQQRRTIKLAFWNMIRDYIAKKHHQMQETHNSCFRSKKTFHPAFFLPLFRVMFFRSETIVKSFFHLMMLFCKLIINYASNLS